MTRRAARLIGAALALVALAAPGLAVPAQGDGAATGRSCFAAADNQRLAFRLFQQAPPPRRRETVGAAGYPHYPLTDAATMQLGRLGEAAPGIGAWYFQWGNRSTAPLRNRAGRLLPRKPNFQPSSDALRRQRSPFTTVARANACTLAQVARLLGRDGAMRQSAQAAGIALAEERATPDSAAEGPADRCVLAARRLPAGARGIFLDYEVGDGRSPQQSLAFLRDFVALVHGAGRKAGVMINPLDAPSQAWTGITADVAGAVAGLFDYTTIWLWGRNAQGDLRASYARQMEILRAGGPVDPQRLLALFDLADTSEDDARFVHQAIVRDHLAGAMLWRNRAVQGGACTTDVNRKTAILAFGAPQPASRPALRGHAAH